MNENKSGFRTQLDSDDYRIARMAETIRFWFKPLAEIAGVLIVIHFIVKYW